MITKGQIEEEGWVDGLKVGREGYVYSVDIISNGNGILIRQISNQPFDDKVLFNGRCPSLNEFRWICKLLNI